MSTKLVLRSGILMSICMLAVPAFGQFRQRKEPAVYEGGAGVSPANRTRPQPLSRSTPLVDPGLVRLNGLTAAEAAQIGTLGGKRRIGVHRNVADPSLGEGTWTVLPDGRAAWRVSITSPTAAGLRIHFSDF